MGAGVGVWGESGDSEKSELRTLSTYPDEMHLIVLVDNDAHTASRVLGQVLC